MEYIDLVTGYVEKGIPRKRCLAWGKSMEWTHLPAQEAMEIAFLLRPLLKAIERVWVLKHF